jgi:hypothetical protein
VRLPACPIPDVEIWFQLGYRHFLLSLSLCLSFSLPLSAENLKVLVVHDMSVPEVTKIINANVCVRADWGGE